MSLTRLGEETQQKLSNPIKSLPGKMSSMWMKILNQKGESMGSGLLERDSSTLLEE